ncbi:hypothetical protein TREMEDRAFT_68429 [Tremella mesenterica DSM 1558]|uniref:uncharacterized protein n=1 Tax=Tremella mesenterica (strain ATCC 24925 / CBS 8224 / DSM 1558 / NBRC 9311 / NRRL Y-6157 / RJB 2259-6 / UBC 559-6) TaxID=578456 RepID=UPI0003F4A500|nr:uncharacterized protein TREMEDRAFT_68429 [Tremella mesenterica DSM 1558]EIW70010.1 hypothetical protein TREMEDRAFT_68429 [Tremella mesenterica DSM 1558]
MDDPPLSASTLSLSDPNSLSQSQSHSRSITSPPEPASPTSPTASTFLRTAQTLEGLAAQLGELDEGREEGEEKCCCGLNGCKAAQERERIEERLKLSGEIGHALLQRYEALERKAQRDVERLERQVEAKRIALLESVRRVKSLDRASQTQLQKYSDLLRKMEGLEKRYTQSLHTQALTQQSLTHVRKELTALRDRNNRQSMALASGHGWEERLAEAEKRYEDARDATEVEEQKVRDEVKKRKRAEARIAELEGQLEVASREIDEVKEARANDAQDLLANAKERLAVLHAELSETFHASDPTETPEYQKTLEDLVATNALLKHDLAEVSAMLSSSREESIVLKTEIDDLRSVVGVARRSSPDHLQTRDGDSIASGRLDLATELARKGHGRTESSPSFATFSDRLGWARMSIGPGSGSQALNGWENRRNSMAHSSYSVSTDLASPGLGYGSVGEYAGSVTGGDGISGVTSPQSGRSSPKQMFRSSPSGGIGYVLNGVPVKTSRSVKRMSIGRPGVKNYTTTGVDPIAEHSSTDVDGSTTLVETDPPYSPSASEYFRQAEIGRKRRSLLLQIHRSASPEPSIDHEPNSSLIDPHMTDLPSPTLELEISGLPNENRVHRRTLLLLTRSRGVQTDISNMGIRAVSGSGLDASTASPLTVEQRSETSSLHDGKNTLASLIEWLAKLLVRLHAADIPSLNKRLKAQRLPGDVGHLSQSTLKTLSGEVSNLRHHFRGLLDVSTASRKEMILLFKLLKDVFTDLIELQSVLNDVTIDPSLAKRLHRKALQDEEEVTAKAAGGGLGWIAAPITKLFTNPTPETTSIQPSKTDGGISAPMAVRAVPKQIASISATTTHVSVEAGAAIARPITTRPPLPTISNKVVDVLPPSPSPQDLVSDDSTSLAPNPALLQVRTLRSSPSRVNRSDLLGIFAGAQPRPSTPTSGSWQVLAHPSIPSSSTSGRAGLRIASSQYFGDRSNKHPRDSPTQRKRLSAMVDAVIDPTADQLDESGTDPLEDRPPSPLLQRTLRPRGLSDSSIRSTFVSQAAIQVDLTAPAPRMGRSVEKRGMLETFSRFWMTRPTTPPPPSTTTSAPQREEIGGTPPIPTVSLNPPTPARPIPVLKRPKEITSKPMALSPTLAASPGAAVGGGFLGMLASSFVGTGTEGGNRMEEGEDMGATLRRPVVGPRNLQRSRV